MNIEKGELKYCSKHDSWQIVAETGNTYDTNSFGLEMAIKVFQFYRVCELLYDEKKSYWYVEFYELTFILDKTCTYEVEFQIDKDMRFPF